MSNSTYHIDIPIIALMILLAIYIHISWQDHLEDRGSKLYRKLLLLCMLDIFFDVVSIVVPLIPGLNIPFLFNLLNGVYFQLNAYMLYTLFFYFRNLREPLPEQNRTLSILSLIPGGISLALLVTNLFLHEVFWYDSEKIYHTGPLYYFIYVLAFLYIIASVVMMVVYRRQYSSRKRWFMISTILTLLVCITIQLFRPELLTIDIGIAISVLLFYLHNNNPVQYVEYLTGALDRSYFDIWLLEQIRMENQINLVAVRASNLSEICMLHGDEKANTYMASLTKAIRRFDPESKVFQLTGTCLLLHSHDMYNYQRNLEAVCAWSESEEARKLLPGCNICIAGIPHAEQVAQEHALESYVDYLYRQLGSGKKIVSNEEYLSGFRYSAEVARYIREAVSKDLFSLAFQPIYHLRRQRFSTVEILTRLDHPAFGSLNPQQIITIAEQNGLIDEITQLQMQRLCAFLQTQPQLVEKTDRFKFNLSPVSILNRHFMDRLIGIITDSGLPLSKFEFEITESIAMEFSPELLNTVQKLKELGIHLSLDDFGCGYSNLSKVLRLPFDSVKLDRSLILEVDKGEAMRKFYKGIIRILQECGMEIVCEGVETQQEARMLMLWGADMVQGYLYSKPLTCDQFIDFLAWPNLEDLPPEMTP